MKIKKPGRMRWVYQDPERKEFVSDGSRIYSYIPEDRQVLVAPVPADNEATTPALFLSGHGNLARDFVASFPRSRSGARHVVAQLHAAGRPSTSR